MLPYPVEDRSPATPSSDQIEAMLNPQAAAMQDAALCAGAGWGWSLALGWPQGAHVTAPPQALHLFSHDICHSWVSVLPTTLSHCSDLGPSATILLHAPSQVPADMQKPLPRSGGQVREVERRLATRPGTARCLGPAGSLRRGHLRYPFLCSGPRAPAHRGHPRQPAPLSLLLPSGSRAGLPSDTLHTWQENDKCPSRSSAASRVQLWRGK